MSMKDFASLVNDYQHRSDHFQARARREEQRYSRYSIVRLISFIAGVLFCIYAWNEWHAAIALSLTIALLMAFGRFVVWHQKIKKQQRHYSFLSELNAKERAALEGDFSGFADGVEFQDPMHPYLIDLDIFGPFSLFQYLNRTSTAIGRQQLAGYLSGLTTVDKIRLRQQAAAELKEQLDWRQEFQALGWLAKDRPEHLKMLYDWLHEPALFEQKAWLNILRWITPLLAITGGVLWLYGTPWYVAVLFILPNAWILRNTLESVNQIHEHTGKAEALLSLYSELIRHVEQSQFADKGLQQLVAVFGGADAKASRILKRLSYIIGQLNVRYNAFAIFLNIFFLWDIHWVRRLEQWKNRHRTAVPSWFEALAQMEALSSLGNLAYNQPHWCMPQVVEGEMLEAVALGHPLIHQNHRVDNDFGMPTRAHIKLVTGSNMAGKSTFLRTVGINIVMAMAGAPACARQLRLPLLEVYTSMRTQDALHESTSSFYAELKRLKFIIEAVEANQAIEPAAPHVFFLLDEILKGTNSKDRHTGSEALIRQLIRFKGAGLIATHDLELGRLEQNSDGAIENLCIEVQIENGELHFDYKLRKGVSESFNATLLMKNMGIRIEEK
jgi:hypothetical protein